VDPNQEIDWIPIRKSGGSHYGNWVAPVRGNFACIVVDGHLSFVTSANFTEAAQIRNVEVGVLMRSSDIASKLTGFFDGMISKGAVEKLEPV
jgi:hypothetical protein